MKKIKIINQTNLNCPPITAKYCDTFMCRFLGLMMQNSISPESGLLLVESKESKVNASIHMLFMKIDIAAIWIDENFKIVDTVLAKKWKPLYTPQAPAKYILETNPSRLEDFKAGDQLKFDNA